MKYKEFEERTDRMSDKEIEELMATISEQDGDELILDFVKSGKDFHKKIDKSMEEFKHLLPPKKQ